MTAEVVVRDACLLSTFAEISVVKATGPQREIVIFVDKGAGCERRLAIAKQVAQVRASLEVE